MAYNWTSTITKVQNGIKKVGLPCQIVYSDGATSSGVYGVSSKKNTMDANISNSAMVSAIKVEVIISYVKRDPIVGDTLIWDKREYTIDGTDPVRPGDVTIANTLTVRLA